MAGLSVLIPVSLDDPKSGLSSVLGLVERRVLTCCMLRRVVDVSGGFGRVFVVSPNQIDIDGASLICSGKNLNPALEDAVDLVGLPVLILPSDIPFVTRDDISRLVGCSGDLVVAPGDRGGTNGLLLRERIDLKYNGGSYEKHVFEGCRRGYSVKSVFLRNVFRDIDEPRDLRFLVDGGFDDEFGSGFLPDELLSKIELRCI